MLGVVVEFEFIKVPYMMVYLAGKSSLPQCHNWYLQMREGSHPFTKLPPETALDILWAAKAGLKSTCMSIYDTITISNSELTLIDIFWTCPTLCSFWQYSTRWTMIWKLKPTPDSSNCCKSGGQLPLNTSSTSNNNCWITTISVCHCSEWRL